MPRRDRYSPNPSPTPPASRCSCHGHPCCWPQANRRPFRYVRPPRRERLTRSLRTIPSRPNPRIRKSTPTVSSGLCAFRVRTIIIGLKMLMFAALTTFFIAGALKVTNGTSSQTPMTCASPPPSEWPVTETRRPAAMSFAALTIWRAELAWFGRMRNPMRRSAPRSLSSFPFCCGLVPQQPTTTSFADCQIPPWKPSPNSVPVSHCWTTQSSTM